MGGDLFETFRDLHRDDASGRAGGQTTRTPGSLSLALAAYRSSLHIGWHFVKAQPGKKIMSALYRG